MNSSIGNNFSNSSKLQTMGIGPQLPPDSGQHPSSADSEQQLDQLLATFIMMLLQQSQGSDPEQESGNDQPQSGQDGLSSLTQMLMLIVMQMLQNQGGACMGGGGLAGSSLGGSGLGGGFNATLSGVTGQA
ncbi:hypothetical protein LL965_08360 [Xanthomonas cassavae CFBP 4642]|uniref:Hpa1 protein n=2 Tax=Xanthomonas cassavae TaxID=56450 RepID=A0ABS8HD80_9XANT|nr:XopA/Hpa1 family type III secretion system protein [Xanthomonas cassavae]MCC4620099.1 hypothetical protein [Xanthomonas cassavae CFBP 4642]